MPRPFCPLKQLKNAVWLFTRNRAPDIPEPFLSLWSIYIPVINFRNLSLIFPGVINFWKQLFQTSTHAYMSIVSIMIAFATDVVLLFKGYLLLALKSQNQPSEILSDPYHICGIKEFVISDCWPRERIGAIFSRFV